MKRLKIIFDAMPLTGAKSGVGYYTAELVQALADTAPDEIEVVGYYFNFMGRKKITHLPSRPNIRYIESRFLPGKILNICRRLGFQLPLEFFTHERADIALFTNYAALPTLSRTRKVVVIHDLSFNDCPQYVSEGNRSFLARWVPRSMASSDIVVTVSNFSKSRIIDVFGIPDTKLYVMPIPLVAQANPSNDILSSLDLKSGYILFVGTIEPRKNLVTLLDAYEQMHAEGEQPPPLVLAGGKGWNDEEILGRINAMQKAGLNVIKTGYVSESERSALYKNATICVLPSHYEGFGMPVLEAMSYGKPVVCSNLPVLYEVGGKAAIYFDKDSSSALARVLVPLISNSKELHRRARLSKKQAETFPSWPEVAKNLYAMLCSLK